MNATIKNATLRTNDCSHMYGCAASITTVEFTRNGGEYEAIRFTRSDTGYDKVEIYIVDRDPSDGWTGKVHVGYANPEIEFERAIINALAAARVDLGADHSARYDLIELDLAA